MVVPLAANSQSLAASPAAATAVAPRRMDTVTPVASTICDAKVRCHTNRYKARSGPLN